MAFVKDDHRHQKSAEKRKAPQTATVSLTAAFLCPQCEHFNQKIFHRLLKTKPMPGRMILKVTLQSLRHLNHNIFTHFITPTRLQYLKRQLPQLTYKLTLR
ncbi:hypothetical protein PDESU_03345 [Pontiella desulfatans]|uniref:Uncharacterized protein n=1 Tax=Pontiella desulfatans TaxID=2750659 RepID=A0A6C2U5U4_PONDE|nr:hypothetical protein PDESU_03345 [Pontiella desulfatans]